LPAESCARFALSAIADQIEVPLPQIDKIEKGIVAEASASGASSPPVHMARQLL
jgi:hypothetical protein